MRNSWFVTGSLIWALAAHGAGVCAQASQESDRAQVSSTSCETEAAPALPGSRVHRPPAGTPARAVYDRMAYVFGNLRQTEYVHHAQSVMAEDDGIYKYDCSGFVGEFVLEPASPLHYADLLANSLRLHPPDPTDPDDPDLRPRAWGFYDYFREILAGRSENCNALWYVFTDHQKIQPGDILVVRYSDAWRSFMEGKSCGSQSTGHVMLAWTFPVASTVNQDEFWIYVIDSAESGHGKDTRRSSYDDVSASDGVGKGKMWYGYDSTRRPVAYRWASASGCAYTLTTGRSTCGYDSGDTDYCKDSDNSDLRHEYYERLEGILLARPIASGACPAP
ncbi:MAG: hypothetical protein ACOYXN_09555 [Acidobacteriota bacterium]